MKRIFVCLIVLMCTVMLCSAASPEVKIPAKGDHPRLVFDKEEFKQLKGMVGGEDVVGKLHDHLMNVADVSVKSTKRYTTLKDENARNIYFTKLRGYSLSLCRALAKEKLRRS